MFIILKSGVSSMNENKFNKEAYFYRIEKSL